MEAPERHMRRALVLARESIDAGNRPFGSVLVRGGTIIAEARNTVYTDDDITAHPELKLARWAGRELNASERRETTMYTSTGPCEMCSGGIAQVELGGVTFSMAGREIASFLGREPGIPAAQILEPETTVSGPVLPEEGRSIHEGYWS